MTWTPELRSALQAVLRANQISECPNCARVLDEEDVSFGGGSTEAGTDYYTVEVDCSACGHELRSGGGWGQPERDEERVEYLQDALADA